MPITFSINHDDEYLVVQYKGAISDNYLLDEWKSFINSYEPKQSIDQFADFSDADLSGLTTTGIEALTDYLVTISRNYNLTSMKIAIYAPHALSFGLSRVYEALSYETTQDIKIFKDRETAIQWLRPAENCR